ncbi:DCP2-domain-containing protein [Daedalea quercina L-15889]|uniref:DCP2-domain-containing protein n=1 Tax=Daedalea quercina L-15889 TaxID=1314783 RepID=A0A165M2H4_9APHY|nr:DCP2-domain-containing protein [Daedalea quercina L-15889]
MASSSSSSPEISAAPTATGSSQSSVQYAHLSREEVLEELSSRFILNLPDEELASVERVCFQMEQAHWYYEDFIREQNPAKFPSYSLKTFCEILFRTCPPLHHLANDHDRAFDQFMQYKTRVPVCGAIMLNATWDKCVLVKGWKSSAGWGFPKGKINQEEPRPRCAVREVLEETGYDLEGQLVQENVIELSIKEQSISLYIVPGVPEDFPFETRTRKEISKIQWFRLSDLPTWRRNKTVPGKFYLISPFIGPLKAFIHDRKPRNLLRRNGQTQTSHVNLNAHASSEDDAGNLDSYATGNGDHTQESSSQSSSADNGEPQTPSPQYSAPHVNYQPPPHLEPHDEAAEINLDGVDPHFARLLNSLSLSASASAVDAAKSPLSKQRALSPPKTISHAVVADTTQSSDLRADWSVSVPHRSSELPRAPSAKQTVSATDYASRPHPSIIPSFTGTSTPALNGIPVEGGQDLQQPRPSSSQLNAPEGQMKSPRFSRARRASRASADISPYLSRPHDIQKELKYISLLENVAKESDRMSRQTPSIPESLHTYSGAPASIPQAFGRPEESLVYSSASAAGLAYPPPNAMPPLDPLYDDPFTVRPRTSTAFHLLPYSPSRKASLQEDQLRYMTPGLESRTPRVPGFGTFPLASGPITFGHPNGVPRPATLAPLRVLPPSQYPMYEGPSQLSPISGPPLSPSAAYAAGAPAAIPPPMLANPMRAANNAHLLSILNTPSTAPRPLAAPGLMSLNGVGPR